MRDNQSALMAIIIMLVIVIGVMAYDHPHHPATVGEKIDDAIDRTGDALHDAGHDIRHDLGHR